VAQIVKQSLHKS